MMRPYIATPSPKPAISKSQVDNSDFSTIAAKPELAVPDKAIPAPRVEPATAIPAPTNLSPLYAVFVWPAADTSAKEENTMKTNSKLKIIEYFISFFGVINHFNILILGCF